MDTTPQARPRSDWLPGVRTIYVGAAAVVAMSSSTIAAGWIAHLSHGGTAAVAFGVQSLTAVLSLATFAVVFFIVRSQALTRREMTLQALASEEKVEQLFEMTDMLQSAMSQMDANSVLCATAERLMPGYGGALYVLNNSRDRLDLSVTWCWPADKPLTQAISPSHCWALKRGKPHVNGLGPGVLRCEHHTAEIAVLEIPMMARGEVYGLLKIHAGDPEPEARLAKVAPLANAMSDAMSLALSNMSLREKLRTQALRDPLTGLYNRRYMEDMLERFVHLADRNGSAVSAIMIDLDHFKRLNDEHGHAMGDAVLREVAAAIVGALRQSDVACRYGGEELVVLLPDCSLNEAAVKAEILRQRIESLSEVHGCPISASFGVASVPETSAQMSDLIAAADAALYEAKQAGRNRVITAPRRSAALSTVSMLVAAE